MIEWKTIDREEVFSSHWIRLNRDSVLLPNGNSIDDYYTADVADAAAVVAVDTEGYIILKEEYRYASRRSLIEIPAGMIESTDSEPIDAARRELLEETGYFSDHWTYMGESIPDPTRLTSRIHLFLAQHCVKKEIPNLDANEEIRVFRTDIDSAVEMVMNGKICAGSSAHAILKAVRLIKA